MGSNLEACLTWVLMVALSPIALLVSLHMFLLNGLEFMSKAASLFVIASINTPFAVAYNVSTLVFCFPPQRLRNPDWSRFDPRAMRNPDWSRFDPRANMGVEIQLIVSDFFKVISDKLLLVLSTGVITFYTSPRLAFYTSMVVGVAATLLTWLNSSSISKRAFSCLCDANGLSPMTFLFSFIGLFDIGCHPIAKCSFIAKKAFVFTNEEGSNEFTSQGDLRNKSIKFEDWNAFERGFFQLSPRIDFISRNNFKKFILKSVMVLKLHNRAFQLWDYHVERLELPEDYPKIKELLNFLDIVAQADGFVTDKMRGRYEHSLTLLEITEGVAKYNGYRVVDPVDNHFVVA